MYNFVPSTPDKARKERNEEKIMKKRWLSFAAILLCIFSGAACAGNSVSDGSEVPGENASDIVSDGEETDISSGNVGENGGICLPWQPLGGTSS